MPVLKVLAFADLILLLLHFQNTQCTDLVAVRLVQVVFHSWIAIPPFSRTCSFTQTAFLSVLTCICLRRTSARWNSGKRRRVTSSDPQLVGVLCDVTAEHS